MNSISVWALQKWNDYKKTQLVWTLFSTMCLCISNFSSMYFSKELLKEEEKITSQFWNFWSNLKYLNTILGYTSWATENTQSTISWNCTKKLLVAHMCVSSKENIAMNHDNKPAAQAAGPDPSLWGSTSRQNPTIQKLLNKSGYFDALQEW